MKGELNQETWYRADEYWNRLEEGDLVVLSTPDGLFAGKVANGHNGWMIWCESIGDEVGWYGDLHLYQFKYLGELHKDQE